MWTPRRIFLALVGLLAFASIYFAYSRLLGNLDGLPPLPDKNLPSGDTGGPQPVPHINSIDRRLELAHGQNCSELRFPIKLEMKRNNALVCAYKFEIIKTGPRAGWIEFSPLSLASFSQKRGADGMPEIDTVYSDVAYFKFDQPIRAMSDFDGRKIVAAELHADPEAQISDPRKGRVRLNNNRRTLDVNDDVEMVTPGPVYYEAEPKPGDPNIYTFTQVQVTDHLNSEFAVPDRTAARDPTMTGVGLRVFISKDPKEKSKTPKAGEPRLSIPQKDPKPTLSGVDVVGLEHSVEMNLWTDANSSFVAPGAGPKKDSKAFDKDKKSGPPTDKRLMQVRTNGPFRYDLNKELAHFEKPAVPNPRLVEHVTVTRSGKTPGQDLLDCEYLDVQFQRKRAVPPTKDAKLPVAKKDEATGEGDLEVKSIRAWGETVVITSDADNLHATGTELIHDADEKMTILKGSPQQQVQAVKDGNLLRGSELHLFGNGQEISQAHVLGAGSIGMGVIDPKTRQYQKQATWTDRFVFTKQIEAGQPTLDVLTFIGREGAKARFKDVSSGQLEQLDAHQLKVYLLPADKEKVDPKSGAKKPVIKTKRPTDKDDPARSSRVIRLEATGEVTSISPDLVIRHTEYLDVKFQDVPKLMKPKPESKKLDPKLMEKGPAPRVLEASAVPKSLPKVAPLEVKGTPLAKGEPAKDEPKKDLPKDAVKPKMPFLVTARKIEAWLNRDPEGRNELDHVTATGEVQAHQDGATKDESGTDIAGDTVDIQAYTTGDWMHVRGIPSTDPAKKVWGVVRFDKLTVFGFDTVVDQRNDTSAVKGEGSMEILSSADMEGKKLDRPTKMTVYWKQKMDFFGAEQQIFYHGAVQAYQEASRLKCEWMQVLLDRPVYLDQERRAKAPRPAPKPGKTKEKEDNSPKVDTVYCFYMPRDEKAPKPKSPQPVLMMEEDKDEKGKVYKVQTIQAPEVVIVNTPLENKRTRHDITATSEALLPGTVRIWQAGQKDSDDGPVGKKEPPKKEAGRKPVPPRKKGELTADEEMKLTVVQFGEKMIAQDLRKRAKFWTNVRLVHLPADRFDVPVDLREGEIPKGAIYMECRATLEVFSTVQREKTTDGKEIDVSYQEMIGIGNVRVRKQGEFFGDADRVTYSELKGTLTFHGTEKNPAVVNQQRGQGVRDQTFSGKTIIYHLRDKTVETIGAIQINR
jgi:hypothetical protein